MAPKTCMTSLWQSVYASAGIGTEGCGGYSDEGAGAHGTWLHE